MRVNPKPQVRHIDVEGKGSPHLTRQRRYSAIYADSRHCPKPDRRDLTQAIEAAKELEVMVDKFHATLSAPTSDSPANIVRNCINCHALPTTPVISRSDHELYYSDVPIESASKHVSLMTANGSIQGDRFVTLSMPMIGQSSNSAGTPDSLHTSLPPMAASIVAK